MSSVGLAAFAGGAVKGMEAKREENRKLREEALKRAALDQDNKFKQISADQKDKEIEILKNKDIVTPSPLIEPEMAPDEAIDMLNEEPKASPDFSKLLQSPEAATGMKEPTNTGGMAGLLGMAPKPQETGFGSLGQPRHIYKPLTADQQKFNKDISVLNGIKDERALKAYVDMNKPKDNTLGWMNYGLRKDAKEEKKEQKDEDQGREESEFLVQKLDKEIAKIHGPLANLQRRMNFLDDKSDISGSLPGYAARNASTLPFGLGQMAIDISSNEDQQLNLADVKKVIDQVRHGLYAGSLTLNEQGESLLETGFKSRNINVLKAGLKEIAEANNKTLYGMKGGFPEGDKRLSEYGAGIDSYMILHNPKKEDSSVGTSVLSPEKEKRKQELIAKKKLR